MRINALQKGKDRINMVLKAGTSRLQDHCSTTEPSHHYSQSKYVPSSKGGIDNFCFTPALQMIYFYHGFTNADGA